MIRALRILAAALPRSAPPTAGAQTQPGPLSLTIGKGSTVQLEYALRDDVGAVFDTNKGQAPLTYTMSWSANRLPPATPLPESEA